MRVARRFYDLALFWKLLGPFLVVMLLAGGVGGALVVRNLASRAQDDLDRDLVQKALTARVALLDDELYLLESGRFAANLEGIADAIQKKDRTEVARLLLSVAALKDKLHLLAATDASGTGVVEMDIADGKPTDTGRDTAWVQNAFVSRALRTNPDGSAEPAGILGRRDASLMAIAIPVAAPDGTRVAGTIVSGVRVDGSLVEDVARRASASVALYGGDGALIAGSAAFGTTARPPALPNGRPLRRNIDVRGETLSAFFTPLMLRGERVGTLAVGLPLEPALASARSTGLRLGLLLALAMAVVAGLGVLVTRLILVPVRALVGASRALGRGELGTRTPVLGSDEHGELAAGFNHMAGQLQTSYEELEKAMRDRQSFFAGISHDFRTPLTSIIGYAQVLNRPQFKGDDATRQEFAGYIMRSGEHLLAMVNDIVDLSKLESEGLRLELDEVKVQDVLKELRGTVAPLAEGAELKLTMGVQRGLPRVWADAPRLRRVILNLASNAIKYTPPAGRVRLSAKVGEDGNVEVSVRDTGLGIPADAAARVFEPFYQVPGNVAQKGQASSGLGLALTKRLVEAHGGRIWLESVPGKGTTFTFTLVTTSMQPPVDADASAHAAAAPEGDEPDSSINASATSRLAKPVALAAAIALMFSTITLGFRVPPAASLGPLPDLAGFGEAPPRAAAAAPRPVPALSSGFVARRLVAPQRIVVPAGTFTPITDAPPATTTVAPPLPTGPANDFFERATAVASLPFADRLETSIATVEQGEARGAAPCLRSADATVWYRFTPQRDTLIGIDARASSFVPVIAIYTGGSVSQLSPVMCEDKAGAAVFLALAGSTYSLQLGGRGTLAFTVSPIGL